jgi:hypothetical protein
LFRNASPEAEITMTIPLFTESSYHLHSVMTGDSFGTFTAEQFRSGLRLTLGIAVEIIEVRQLE